MACLSFYGSHSRTLQCLRYFREPAQLQVLDRLTLASFLGRECSSKLLPFRVWSPSELLHLFRGVIVKTRTSVLALEKIYPSLVVIAIEVREQTLAGPEPTQFVFPQPETAVVIVLGKNPAPLFMV